MNIHNKHILLTGATGGLGQAIAVELAKKQAVVGLVGRDKEKLMQLKDKLAQLGCVSHCIVNDLTQTGASQTLYKQAKATLGNIDILINNAGVLDFIALQDQTDERIAEILHTNVTSLIQLTRHMLPDFMAKNDGHFVFIGSIFGSLAFPHFATYCASKFAVHGFSQALRRELVNTQIGVTYIAPRGIDTPMNKANIVAMWKKSGNAVDKPELVASKIIKAIEKKEQEVFIGQPQSFFAWLNGIAPKIVNFGLKKQTALAEQFLK